MNFKLTKREDGYILAECPDLPGCMSQGKTYEEALRNIKAAAALYIEENLDDDELTPEQVAVIELLSEEAHQEYLAGRTYPLDDLWDETLI